MLRCSIRALCHIQFAFSIGCTPCTPIDIRSVGLRWRVYPQVFRGIKLSMPGERGQERVNVMMALLLIVWWRTQVIDEFDAYGDAGDV